MVATSLALMCTAYQPTSSAVNVTGSVFTIRYCSPTSMTAQSSPKRGPMRTRESCLPAYEMQVLRKSIGSLPWAAYRLTPHWPAGLTPASLLRLRIYLVLSGRCLHRLSSPPPVRWPVPPFLNRQQRLGETDLAGGGSWPLP